MKTNTTVWKLYCGLLLCLLGLQGVKAQKQDVELDADGIMRVGAPITIVTIGILSSVTRAAITCVTALTFKININFCHNLNFRFIIIITLL